MDWIEEPCFGVGTGEIPNATQDSREGLPEILPSMQRDEDEAFSGHQGPGQGIRQIRMRRDLEQGIDHSIADDMHLGVRDALAQKRLPGGFRGCEMPSRENGG
jgi:hypothetical protein